MLFKRNHRVVARDAQASDNSLAMLKPPNQPDKPGPTNRFDVAKDAIAMGHSPAKSAVLLIPWPLVIGGIIGIIMKLIGG